MKYAKMLGLLAVAAAALMAFAGSASATTLTSPAGTTLGKGATIHASLKAETEAVLSGTINVKCKKSTVAGEVKTPGSETTTVSGPLSTLTFDECNPNTASTVKLGNLEVHTEGASSNGNGTLTASEVEATVLTHTILGTTHCLYTAENLDIGKVTGSINNGSGNATLTASEVELGRKTTDFGCGEVAKWTATYVVSTPSYLDVD
jgi:hypothetical protein